MRQKDVALTQTENSIPPSPSSSSTHGKNRFQWDSRPCWHSLRPKNMLHVAVVRTSVDMITSLLETNASVNALDEGGWSPLHLAVYLNRADMVNALLAASADPWQTLDLRGTSKIRVGS